MLNSCDLIAMTGGISHIMASLQKSFALDQFETASYLMKTLTNLANYRSPLIKLLFIELNYTEVALELVRLLFTNLLKLTDEGPLTKSCEHIDAALGAGLELIKVVVGGGASNVAGVSQNKIHLVEKTNFLLTCTKMLQAALDSPAHATGTVISIFQLIEHLCGSAQ